MSTSVQGRWEWRVKDSLLAYMQGQEDFAIEASGDARFDAIAGVSMGCLISADGTAHATGHLTLSAHGGALEVALRNAVIESDGLWIDDPLDDSGEGRLRLVDLSAPRRAGDTTSYEARLSSDATILFSYNYPAGTSFADLVLIAPARDQDDG